MWILKTSEDFDVKLEKLDKSNQVRIIKYLQEVTKLEDPKDRGKPLSGNLKGTWAYRIGRYRVFVDFIDEEVTIFSFDIGHRSNVYKQKR